MHIAVTLKTPIQYLKGVGPEKSKTLARLGLKTLSDLLYFFPRRHENRAPIRSISQIEGQDKECVRGTVQARSLIRLKNGMTMLKVVFREAELPALRTQAKPLWAVWFNQPYLHKVFIPKATFLLYGKAEKVGPHFQMTHPEYELAAEGVDFKPTIHSGRIVPIYPLTEDLGQKTARSLVYRVLELFSKGITDPLPAAVKKRLSLPSRDWALGQYHFPEKESHIRQAYERLVFDEFFMMQTALEFKKARFQAENRGFAHQDKTMELQRLLDVLDFELTRGQKKAIADILQDMKSGRVMSRLVQGDVGSGKTVVAAAALFFTASNGFQGALMAPTEVLAQQHYIKLSQLLEPLGISCAYLAQNLQPAQKQKTLQDIASGACAIVIGTHALIEEGVRFHRLGLAVIDEQHKFGVFQRAALKQKGMGSAHLLLMTATPIPRTLALTAYGDLDISIIAERPKGRGPIETLWVEENRRQDVYTFLEKILEGGGQGYCLCPLIEVKGKGGAKTIFDSYRELSQVLSHRKFAILHGKMKADAKQKIMQDFKDKKIDVLISTVVIEVGIDVPNASIMIIENAEKFGLAQLHQLRGRVGRGEKESYCFLFSKAASEDTTLRLELFTQTQSGFEIAEKDLSLRGGGDILGAKQHGLPKLRIGDLVQDVQILELAKQEARQIIETDPKLLKPEHRMIYRAADARYRLGENKTAIAV